MSETPAAGPPATDDAAHPEDLPSLLRLEQHGPDTWVGSSVPTPWNRVFGGQVVAQALWAAALTVEEAYVVHSLRAYFIRGGDLFEPIRFEVDRIRNGRSFVTRRVVARQSAGAILNLDASFQVPEDLADVQPRRMPSVPPPDECVKLNWGPLNDRRLAVVDQEEGHIIAWMPVHDPLPEPLGVGAACSLAFASDDGPMMAARTLHPIAWPPGPNDRVAMSASLDHASWFHRPLPTTGWLLYDLRASGWHGGRGLGFGSVFAPDGTHVASVAQEALVREVG